MTDLRYAAEQKMNNTEAFDFFLISCRLFEKDWRVNLFREFGPGHRYYHLRVGGKCIITDPQAGKSVTYDIIELFRLVRKIRSMGRAGATPVYFVSTATAMISAIIILRMLLAKGVWLYDAYDDFSMYMASFIDNLKGHFVNAVFYRIMHGTLIAPPNLRRKFKRAAIFHVGSSINGPVHGRGNYKSVLITSNFDPRLDYEFIGRVAALCPEREMHLYGRINDIKRDGAVLDALQVNNRNVKYCGEFSETEFFDILSNYSVAIAPFKMDVKFTYSTDPSRFYDYLNAGIEVISTDITRAREQSEFIHVVRSADEAAVALNKIEMSPGWRKHGRWDYRLNTWGHRAGELLAIIDVIAARTKT